MNEIHFYSSKIKSLILLILPSALFIFLFISMKNCYTKLVQNNHQLSWMHSFFLWYRIFDADSIQAKTIAYY